ncbi:C-type mannose receptor 2-like [Pangasianodon hypophthalmus]|uniref:C-type mannose receptor 2-like n=1 Tax=Pangasianodon hypophthalmus TaxID=310915 RepID=UPI002307FF3A|nr:C-type mannose receptor 2-like [Pangasianodon hypophthalmus]
MKHLFILLFFTGVIPIILPVPRKYYLIQLGRNWSDAQVYCRATYTDLATIETTDDMVQLQNAAQSQQVSSGAWIGLYNDINSWRWSMGNEPLGRMTDWDIDFLQPNNLNGDEECAVIDIIAWLDRPCTEIKPSVCFDDRNTDNNRYIYIPDLMTWREAQSYCRQHHTDLASARNETENSLIKAMVFGETWFGLFRDSWKWSDQTNFTTITWAPGEPDNYQGNENCVLLYDGQVDDTICSDIRPFYCHSVLPPVITGQKQIIRVKVQSNQDVNDPAVKVVVLDKITQKLKDHGITENVTVKWREQPDGLVFNKEKENATLENTIINADEL